MRFESLYPVYITSYTVEVFVDNSVGEHMGFER